MITCERCGARLKIGQGFCEGCGAPVGASSGGGSSEPVQAPDPRSVPGSAWGAPAPIAPPPGAGYPSTGYPPMPPGSLLGPPAGGGGSRSRAKLLVPIAIVVVVAVAVIGFVVLRNGDGDGSRADARPNGEYLGLRNGPTGEPEERWSERIDCDTSCQLGVGDNTVYVASSGSRGTDVEAFDASSGESRWKQRRVTDDSVYGVTVIGDRVLLRGDGVVALDAADGEEAWKAKESFSDYVAGDVVFLVDYGNDDSGDTRTSAVSLRDGDEQWSEDGIIQGVCSGVAYLDESSKRIVALDASSGDQRWKRSLGITSMTCGPDGVFASDGDDLHRLDPGDGKDLWSKSIDGAPRLVSDGLVLVEDGEGCRAHEVGKGDKQWRSDEFSCPFLPLGGGRGISSNQDSDIVLVGLAEGERLDRRRSAASGEESPPGDLGSDLYVELDGDQLDAVGYDGNEFADAWSIDVDRQTTAVKIGSGSVFTLADDELTAYR